MLFYHLVVAARAAGLVLAVTALGLARAARLVLAAASATRTARLLALTDLALAALRAIAARLHLARAALGAVAARAVAAAAAERVDLCKHRRVGVGRHLYIRG